MRQMHNALDAAQWLRTQVTGELRTDSRKVQPGDGFIAWPGAATDGRRYLSQALAQGATACLLEEEGHAPWLNSLPVGTLGTERLAVMPTRALTATRELMRGAGQRTLDQHLDVERDTQSALGRTHDYIEGVSAFLQKRTAQFTGH